ncbi:MAG: glycosyltransferase [Candidatus Dependentiae bacterium]|nr:glycosyltransferase [Candidatus Dependentiae bacterium]
MSLNPIKRTLFSIKRFFVPYHDDEPSNTANPYAISFDKSMGKGSYYYEKCMKATKGVYTIASSPESASSLMAFFRSLYERNNLTTITPSSTLKIPTITHQIWVGNVFPKKFHAWRNSWLHHHPTWTHIFWTDNPINYGLGTLVEDIATLKTSLSQGTYAGQSIVVDIKHLDLYNQKYYDTTINLGEKTDILRYEIVYMLGGVYLDIDFECFKPLDLLHYCYDFYTGIQPLDETLALGAALFAGPPDHPILKKCVETIPTNQQHKNIIERTGPVHFTRAFRAVAADCPGTTIAFPARYFYPVGLRYGAPDPKNILSLLKPESFAVHHWAGSWVNIKWFFKK